MKVIDTTKSSLVVCKKFEKKDQINASQYHDMMWASLVYCFDKYINSYGIEEEKDTI